MRLGEQDTASERAMTSLGRQAMIVSMEHAHNSFGPFVLDGTDRLLRRDGQPLQLGQRAFDLLAALVEANGAAVDKDQREWADLPTHHPAPDE
jgi:DNA-binding response OmpR family regulator